MDVVVGLIEMADDHDGDDDDAIVARELASSLGLPWQLVGEAGIIRVI